MDFLAQMTPHIRIDNKNLNITVFSIRHHKAITCECTVSDCSALCEAIEKDFTQKFYNEIRLTYTNGNGISACDSIFYVNEDWL